MSEESRPSDPLTPDDDELAARRAAERRGDPYLVYSDHAGHERVLSLPGSWERVTIGRGLGSDVPLAWDSKVSSAHAQLERSGDDWILVDDGLSRNGSFVNGQRVDGQRRLLSGDRLQFGDTKMEFHAPFQVTQETVVATDTPPDPPGSEGK